MKKHEIYFPFENNSNVDITDLSLYNYDFSAFSLVPLQNIAKQELINTVKDKALSNTSQVKLIKKLMDKGDEEYVANLTDLAKEKLRTGEWQFGVKKDTKEVLAVLRDTKSGHISSQLTLDKKVIKDLGSLPELSAMQSQLYNISEQIENLTRLLERVEQGQYNDRYAGFFSARQMTIEGLSASNKKIKKDLLVGAAIVNNETIAKLMLAIHHDTHNFMSMKTSPKEARIIEGLIENSLGYLNSSIQLNLAIYTALGEHQTVLSTISNYQAFIQQTLLKEIDGNGRTIAWKLDNAHKGNDSKIEQFSSTITDNIKLLLEDGTNNGDDKIEEIEGRNMHFS